MKEMKHPGAIVSVRFERKDFEIVARAAEGAGVPLSRFIREAALRRVSPRLEERKLTTNGATSSVAPVVVWLWPVHF